MEPALSSVIGAFSSSEGGSQGVTVEQAAADVERIGAALAEEFRRRTAASNARAQRSRTG
jgi:hypothetical protein